MEGVFAERSLRQKHIPADTKISQEGGKRNKVKLMCFIGTYARPPFSPFFRGTKYSSAFTRRKAAKEEEKRMSEEYVKVPGVDVDYELLGNAVHQARGNRALDKFALDVGYSPRSMFNLANNKFSWGRSVKLPPQDWLIDNIADKADIRTGITADTLYAAEGRINSRYLCVMHKGEIVHFAEWKQKNPMPDYFGQRKHKKADQVDNEVQKELEKAAVYDEQEQEAAAYITFRKDLAFIVQDMALDEQKREYVRSHARSFFIDKALVRLIAEYKRLSAATQKELEEMYLGRGLDADITVKLTRFRKVVQEYMFKEAFK